MDVNSTPAQQQAQQNNDLRQKYSQEAQEIKAQAENNLRKMREEYERKIAEIQNAYEVEISKEAQEKEAELNKIKAVHNKELLDQENLFKDTFAQVTDREQKKIEAYKRSQEAVLAKIQKEYSNAIENKKAAAREQGIEIDA